MLNELRKKKMLESLGVNHTQKKNEPNNVNQDKDVVKKASDNMQALSISAPNTAKLNNQSMQKVSMKPDLENKEEDLEKTIGYQKAHQTLGIPMDEEDKEEKKQKMLASLFKKR